MQCPKCHLINPGSALRCDCGYDFATGEMKASYLSRGHLKSRPNWVRSYRGPILLLYFAGVAEALAAVGQKRTAFNFIAILAAGFTYPFIAFGVLVLNPTSELRIWFDHPIAPLLLVSGTAWLVAKIVRRRKVD